MGMSFLGFAWRMLRRDARAGELRLLVAALLTAVAALTAVGFFTDRVRQALVGEANQLLGADLLLVADHPWSEHVLNEARALGLRVAQTQTFPSMVAQGEGDALRAQLAEIKAVSAAYPLRGALRVASSRTASDAPASGIPMPGTIWIDVRLADQLHTSVGAFLELGQQRMRIAALLTLEPDRGVNFFSVAPRVLMNLDDLSATGLVQPGSRVGYRVLLAGDAGAIDDFRAKMEPVLERGARIEDARNARPEIRVALERAQKFLGLAALLTVILAAVAMALASRRYLQRHLDPCAVMRCLGATQGFLLRVYLGQFVLLGFVATGIGCVIGYVTHFALYAWLAPLLGTALPAPGWMPAVQGAAVGMLLLFGFSCPPLFQLRQVSTLRVLRREFSTGSLPPSRLLGAYLAGFAALAGLMFWIAGDLRLGAYLVAGFSLAMVLFALVARLAIRLASQARGRNGRHRGGIGWRYGLASLERHALANVVQIVALSLGFMALLLLTVTRHDLLQAWHRAIPPEAPNRFVINIQPDQLASVRQWFSGHGMEAEFAPMIRGRLTRVNGVEVDARKYADERAQRMVEREFNLSYRRDLPPGNTVTAGRWMAADTSGKGTASVEAGLAKTLGLKLGDQLEFSVAGETVVVRILSLRELNWDSMRVNFFVLTPPETLQAYPASWITSFYLARENAVFANQLVGQYPNLTVIDVAAIIQQLQSIMDQVARAVQFVFLFTVVAGFVVLYAALVSATEERRYELAVMRALGARRGQLQRALLTELSAIGGLSGLIAAFGAMAVGQVLARKAFELEVPVDLSLPIVAMGGGALLVALAGWFAVARLVDTPPLEALRTGN